MAEPALSQPAHLEGCELWRKWRMKGTETETQDKSERSLWPIPNSREFISELAFIQIKDRKQNKESANHLPSLSLEEPACRLYLSIAIAIDK